MVNPIIPHVQVNGVDLDLGMILTPLSIRHGRSGPDAQPDAPTCDFIHIGDVKPCAVGDRLKVLAARDRAEWRGETLWGDPTISWAGTDLVNPSDERFVGVVSSLKAVEQDGVVIEWEISATGGLAQLGLMNARTPVPSGGRPQESDVDRVLAEDVISPISVPPHDNSAMDGFAFDSAALAPDQPLTLRVAGTAFAGKAWSGTVAAGECLKIITGAIMPTGLDTVLPLEFVKTMGETIDVPPGVVKAGDNRRFAGEELMAGQPALRRARGPRVGGIPHTRPPPR